MSFLWAFYGLTASLFHASYLVANQYLRFPGWAVMVLMRMGIVIALLPFALTTTPVTDGWFYVAVFATSILAFNADSQIMTCIKDFGAGPVSRVFALTIPTSFILWSILHPSSLQPLINHPVAGSGAFVALCLTTYFIFELKKCELSVALLKRFVPVVVLLFAPIDIINKTAMNRVCEDLMTGSFAYIFFQSVGVVTIVVVWGAIKHLFRRHASEQEHGKPQSFDMTLLKTDIRAISGRRLFVGVSSVAFFFMAYMFFKNLGMSHALNPAFITLLVSMSPFWIIVINKLTAYQDGSDIKSGIGLLFSALALVVFATLAKM